MYFLSKNGNIPASYVSLPEGSNFFGCKRTSRVVLGWGPWLTLFFPQFSSRFRWIFIGVPKFPPNFAVSLFGTWRIIPVSTWLAKSIYKPMERPFGSGKTQLRGLAITMVTNHVSESWDFAVSLFGRGLMQQSYTLW